MLNQCVKCSAELRNDEPIDRNIEPDDIPCCCGVFDRKGNLEDATCINCCIDHSQQIWEGKQAGGGYYIVNPQ